MNWEEYLGLKISAFIAGIVGAVISLTYEEKLSFWRAIFLIFAGGVTAGYGFKGAQTWLGFSDNLSGFFGFLLGLISMRLVDSVLQLANLLKKNPKLLLTLPELTKTILTTSTTNDRTFERGDNTQPNMNTAGEAATPQGSPEKS